MRRIFPLLKEASERGEDTVLATIVEKTGSTPRGAGAHMLVNAQGLVCGTIGGGAGENDAIETAKRVLRERRCRKEKYRLYPNGEKDLDMVCGGEMTVHFQFLPGNNRAISDMADEAERCYQKGEPCWLIIGLSLDAANSVSLYSDAGLTGAFVPRAVLEKSPSRPQCVEEEGRTYYMERLQQPGRVYIFGGGHVAQALVPVLASVDFRCVVVEDRPEFCEPELFPQAEEIRLIPMEKLAEQLSIRPADYICVMTRGHRNDTDCEAFALGTPARYIGVIGSRRKRAAVHEKLKARGFTEKDLKRVAAPIGLPIGAETPAEIAVSIAAQLIKVRAGVEVTLPI